MKQQIKITKLIISNTNLENVRKKYPKLYAYLVNYVSMMMTVSSVLLVMKGDKVSLQKREELWNFIKEKDKNLYKKLKYCKLAGLTYLPSKIGNFITLKGYKIAQKVYRFN